MARGLPQRTSIPAAVAVAAVLLLFAAALSACSEAASPEPEQTAPASAAASSQAQTSASSPAASGTSSPSASLAASPTDGAVTPAAVSSAEAAAVPEAEPPLERPSKKDPLRVYFGGDSLSGMPAVMLGILTKKNGLARVKADYVESSRLTYGDPIDWPARVKQQMAAGRWDVGVFMIGANDSGMPMIAGGESVMYPKKAWLEEYKRRVKKVAVLMLRGGVDRVYWVGMPVMPSASESRKMRDLNDLFEDVARSSPDVVYVDSYDLLSTKGGDHKASVRSGDGVHYTDEGALLVAKAVWKAIKQDWGGR